VIETAQRLADDVLFPDAQRVDAQGIPDTHFDALADAGLFSLDGLSPTVARRVLASIAGGCGATYFVWVQHHGVLRTLAASSNNALRTGMLPEMQTGDAVAGVAFAHMRREGTPAVTATKTATGWRLDGTAPWATSWGIADWFCVAAGSPDGKIVWSMLPGIAGLGLTATALHLPVFASTGTVALQFDGYEVAESSTMSVDDLDAWRRADRLRAALGQPAILGVAARAIRLLGERYTDAQDASKRLAAQLADLWDRDDVLLARLGESGTDDVITAASDHRSACLDIGRRATTALLAASGGAGMDMHHPAQRLAREALFYVIQAQTADGRAATLRSISRSPGRDDRCVEGDT
jgi:alkylation response protein AidB-like acyl-CoA dehydrogenase